MFPASDALHALLPERFAYRKGLASQGRGARALLSWGSPYSIYDNVQRFMLAGAANRPLREGSAAGIRAGEHKTC
jgi:hypothetical protein